LLDAEDLRGVETADVAQDDRRLDADADDDGDGVG
jgi:hypothetical protein